MNFLKYQTYKWNDILTPLNAVDSPVRFLLRHKDSEKIVAACVRIDLNPRAPYEIIPSQGEHVAPWSDKFAAQTEPVPVFVKESDGQWYYRGDFKVAAQSADANEIRLREQQANRAHVYKILFLEEVLK